MTTHADRLWIGAALVIGLFAGCEAPGHPRVVPLRTESTAWIRSPAFSGKVLHWTQTERGAADEVTHELWLRMGSDGAPARLHSRSILADGSVGESAVEPRPGAAVDLERLGAAAPKYADEAQLFALGYAQTIGPSHRPLPETPFLLGVSPEASYGADATVHRWQLTVVGPDRAVHSRSIECNADGRVLAMQATDVDARGLVVGESATVYGGLDVYEASAIPSSVF